MEYGASESIRFVGFSDANEYMSEKSNTLFLASRPNTDAKKLASLSRPIRKRLFVAKIITAENRKWAVIISI